MHEAGSEPRYTDEPKYQKNIHELDRFNLVCVCVCVCVCVKIYIHVHMYRRIYGTSIRLSMYI
jgi:hypothetical protein